MATLSVSFSRTMMPDRIMKGSREGIIFSNHRFSPMAA